VIFQYSSNAHFAGYDGDIDVNVFYGTKEDWRAMAAVKRRECVSVTAELPVLKRGSMGRAVKVWQSIAGAKTDGVFGPATDAATRAYQADNDLSADGMVGKKTWTRALEGLKNG
jgi:peptidoglycan hydrolase-like protein with peptidoglycan-binding domain